MIDENAVTAIGEIEWNILIGLLAAGAAIFVPDIDDLPILKEGSKPFPETVDVFAHAEAQLLMNKASSGCVYKSGCAPAARSDDFSISDKFHQPITARVDSCAQVAAC